MAAREINPFLRIVLEIGPIAGFFLAWRLGSGEEPEIDRMIRATLVFVPLVLGAIGLSYGLTRTLPRMAVVTAVVVVVFGALTVLLRDDTFVKMKPTIINGIFAAVLGFGLLRGESYLQYLMGTVLPMRREGWMTFTRRFALWFLALAVLNEIVWRTQTTDTWVNFRTFVLPVLTFGFVMSQMPMLSRHMEK